MLLRVNFAHTSSSFCLVVCGYRLSPSVASVFYLLPQASHNVMPPLLTSHVPPLTYMSVRNGSRSLETTDPSRRRAEVEGRWLVENSPLFCRTLNLSRSSGRVSRDQPMSCQAHVLHVGLADKISSLAPRQFFSNKLSQVLHMSARINTFDGGHQILREKAPIASAFEPLFSPL